MEKGHLVDVKASIRAFIISTQDSMTIQDLQKDFQAFTGQPLPYSSLGFTSAEQLLRSIPDVVKVIGYGPQAILKHVPNEKSKHIADFVKHQKPTVNKKRHNRIVRRRGRQSCPVMEMSEDSPEEIYFEHIRINDSKPADSFDHFSNNMETKLLKCPSQIKQTEKENQVLNETLEKRNTVYDNKDLESSSGKNILIHKRFNIILSSSDEKDDTHHKETTSPKQLNKFSESTASPELDSYSKVSSVCLGSRYIPIKEVKNSYQDAIPEDAMTDIIDKLDTKRYKIKKEQYTQENLEIPQCKVYNELKKGSIFPLYISEIQSPLIFFFHIGEEGHELIKLEDRLQKMYSILPPNDLNVSPASIEPGKFCAAKNGENWYRAKILSVPTYLNDFSKIKLLFIDYGCINQVPIKHIRHLAPIFFKIPVQAARGRLSGIKSNGLASSVGSINFFASLANHRCLYAYVSEINKNDPSLDLILLDTSFQPKRNINELLIRKGFAKRNDPK